MTETNYETQETTVSFGDGVVALLSSLGMGGFAWGAVWATIELVQFGLASFNILPPDSATNAYYIELVLLNLPWLAGVLVGFVNYGKVLKLPDED